MFERLLNSLLEWFLESSEKLNEAQSGFRRGRSTKDNIVALWSAIKIAFANKKHVFDSFIDIKGAFDWVNVTILISELNLLGAPEYFCHIIHLLFFKKTSQ